MKYIRHEDIGIILWPDKGTSKPWHKDIAKKFGIDKITSAGFAKFNSDEKLKCYGMSQSLNLLSDDADTDILIKELGGN